MVVPGVFFGLNLAVFFAGATHNSVANAALIGSLAPFLIVPVGAALATLLCVAPAKNTARLRPKKTPGR